VNIKEVWVLVLGCFVFLSAVSPGYSLVLDTRGRLGGKVGSSSEEFENIKGGQFTRVVLDKGPLTCYCVLWCISGLPLQL